MLSSASGGMSVIFEHCTITGNFANWSYLVRTQGVLPRPRGQDVNLRVFM